MTLSVVNVRNQAQASGLSMWAMQQVWSLLKADPWRSSHDIARGTVCPLVQDAQCCTAACSLMLARHAATWRYTTMICMLGWYCEFLKTN